MKSIGVGIIGWGFMGRTHTHALRSIPLFYRNLDFEPRLAAVCSGHLENALADGRAAALEIDRYLKGARK